MEEGKVQKFSNRNKFHYKIESVTLQDICTVYESVIVTEQNKLNDIFTV